MVGDEVGTTDGAVDVTSDHVDDGETFGGVGYSGLVRVGGTVIGAYGDVSFGSRCVEDLGGRFQQA